jgi:hypothetical protein
MTMQDNDEKQQQQQQLPRQVFPINNNSGIVVDEVSVASLVGGNAAATTTTTITARTNNTTTTTSHEDGVCNALSAKLVKMSVKDRTAGIYELHGVADMEDETPEMLRSKLAQVSHIADSFDDNERAVAYQKAKLFGTKEYMEKIKLMCLRADYYDCHKAAARLVSFFSFKRQLFGDAKLTKEIILDDFEGGDKEAMENGLCQLLQEKDQAGRAVVLGVGVQAPNSTMETIVSMAQGRVLFMFHFDPSLTLFDSSFSAELCIMCSWRPFEMKKYKNVASS